MSALGEADMSVWGEADMSVWGEADMSVLGEADSVALGERRYRPGLATSELVAEIRGVLAAERRAERLVCRYLADLADRIQARRDMELGVYDDEFQVARRWFGLGARDTRERVRVGRALRRLPEIERALIDGELCYSRVREVTRVATVSSERDWLEVARRLDMRSLERRVAHERAATDEKPDRHDERRVGERARTRWMGPATVRVTFELSVEAWTVLERAMREARRAGTSGPTDADALEAVARAALSVPRADPTGAGDVGLPCQWPTWDESVRDGGAADPERSITQARECGEATRRSRTARELGSEATQGGSAECAPEPGAAARELGSEATQGGSAECAPAARDRWMDGGPSASGLVDQAGEPAVRLMQVMGRSGGWTLDALIESSGLSAQEACLGLTLLELGGRVRRRAFAFDPV
jgi:hypothetical protein